MIPQAKNYTSVLMGWVTIKTQAWLCLIQSNTENRSPHWWHCSYISQGQRRWQPFVHSSSMPVLVARTISCLGHIKKQNKNPVGMMKIVYKLPSRYVCKVHMKYMNFMVSWVPSSLSYFVYSDVPQFKNPNLKHSCYQAF